MFARDPNALRMLCRPHMPPTHLSIILPNNTAETNLIGSFTSFQQKTTPTKRSAAAWWPLLSGRLHAAPCRFCRVCDGRRLSCPNHCSFWIHHHRHNTNDGWVPTPKKRIATLVFRRTLIGTEKTISRNHLHIHPHNLELTFGRFVGRCAFASFRVVISVEKRP